MNILAGVHQRDEGEIEFDGEQMHDISVKRTEQAGIAFVHQELNLFNDLKVYENIFLRKELLTKLGTLDKRAMLEQTRQLMSDLGVDIDPNALVDELETSKKQLLEIAKALHANAKLFILDEPTTALNNAEIEHLFSIVRRLKEQGKSFIFISHKMNEIFTMRTATRSCGMDALFSPAILPTPRRRPSPVLWWAAATPRPRCTSPASWVMWR